MDDNDRDKEIYRVADNVLICFNSLLVTIRENLESPNQYRWLGQKRRKNRQ